MRKAMRLPALALIAASAILAISALSSCARGAAKSQDFTYYYPTDPSSFNYLTESHETNSTHTANFEDGLLEHDRFGALQPSLATSWKSNADYTVWTFSIRKGAKWVTSEAEQYAEVKAQDWATSLKYALDNKSPLVYLINGFIKNAEKYSKGELSDFTQVGVKALDDYTLQYTMETSIPYFDTMVTYMCYYPANAEFLAAKGKDFGKVDKDSILYNGAYLLANYTAKSVIEYDANPTYWDKARVSIKHVKLVFNDLKDPDSLFNNFDQGTYVMAPVYTDNEAVFAKAQSKYKDNLFRSVLDASTFCYAFNYNRQAYASPADPTKGKSPKSAKAKADTKLAVMNRDFRKAFFFGIDRVAVLAQRNGEPNKLAALRNTYTCPELASDSAGKDYVKYVESALKALNPKDFPKEMAIDDGQDPYFNPEKAKASMAAAKAELGAKGVQFPVQIDVAVDVTYTKGVKMDQSFKQGVESLFGADTVKINLVEMDRDNQTASTYLIESGSQANYDVCDSSGWGPDYGDPFTYLQTLLPVEGATIQSLGLNAKGDGPDAAAAEAVGLNAYAKLVKEANAEYKDRDKRLALFAKAEAFLLDEAVVLPYMARGGSFAVSRVQPYTQIRSVYGSDDEKYKGRVVTDHVITLAERDKLKAQWEKDKAEAFKKASKK